MRNKNCNKYFITFLILCVFREEKKSLNRNKNTYFSYSFGFFIIRVLYIELKEVVKYLVHLERAWRLTHDRILHGSRLLYLFDLFSIFMASALIRYSYGNNNINKFVFQSVTIY